MLKKIQLAALALSLFFVSLYAHSVSVWTLDEQLSSTNLTVLRFKVQNTSQQTIRGLELHYRVKQEWSEIAPAEAYYISGASMEWVQLGGGEALLKILFPNVVLGPMEEFPNSSGFSVGLHTKNWTAWSKQDDYSQPVSNVFTLTDRIPVYSNGILLNGETPVSNVACPDVWFLEIQTDSVKIGWKPSNNQEHTTLELRSFNGATLEVNLAQAADSGSYREWSGAFPVQHQNRGELWLNCSGKMAAYFAYGRVPENANPAVEAGLWDNESDFVPAHSEFGYNMGIYPKERFIVKPEQFGRRIADWKLYRAWEAPDLPELPTIAFPGFGVAFMPETPNDSMLFAWTAVEGFSLYQLNVVKDSAYGDTLHSILVSGTEIRLPTPPPGVYVWWAEPVTRSRISLTGIGRSLLKSVVQTTPIVSHFTDKDVSLSESIIKPFFTATPIGIFNVMAGGVIVQEKTLGLTPIRARKDTRMLDLGWGDSVNMAIDSGWWDRPNTKTTGKLRDDEENRCWAIAIQQLNHYFGGDMTQDEIVYHWKSHGRPIENHFPHKDFEASGFPDIIPTMAFALNSSSGFQNVFDISGVSDMVGLLISVPGWFARPPDPYTVIASIIKDIPVVVIQANQGYSAAHVMVIDGYKIYADGSIYLHFVGVTNYGREKEDAEWRYYASIYGMGVDVFINEISQSADNTNNLLFDLFVGTDFHVAYYIPSKDAKGRLTDSLVYKDTDKDSIVDFDEIYRFGTDPNKKDSDGDGIPDKMEIAYYTRLGVSADIDHDGLRAELDVDSDGDWDCDRDENANKDDKKDPDETNMMNSTSRDSTGRQNFKINPVTLLATEQININDRAYCTDGSSYCPIVSMWRGIGNAVQLGVSAKVGSILAGSSVWLRSNAIVYGDINSAKDLILQNATPQVLGTIRQNDAETAMLVQVYRPKLYNANSNKGIISGTMQIPSGQTVTLRPGTYNQNIVVSSGSVLRLQPGTYRMGNLTVQSGGKIELSGGGNIALEISDSFRWDGSLLGSSIQEAASRLKIQALGSQDIFLNTSFGGFLVAPNAHVVVGQANKDYAGQIYAKRITLHQNTRFQWVQPGASMNVATFNRGNIHVCYNN